MQFSLTVKVKVIVLGFTAVLWISQFCFRLRIVIEMENSDISISRFQSCLSSKWKTPTFREWFQNYSLKETTNLKYTKCFYYIPNGLRYLIPFGHLYFNAVDLNICLSVSACSRLQWPQEL